MLCFLEGYGAVPLERMMPETEIANGNTVAVPVKS